MNHYTSFIQSHPGWELVGIFADEGLSGTQAKTRPQFNALIAACEEGAVNLVITKSISRFARNTLDALNYIRKLKALNMVMKSGTAPLWMNRDTENENEESGACRDYDDFFSRTRYTVPEGVLDENGRMESFNNDLVIRYLDRVIVRDDGYEVVFKAGVKVQVEV